MDGNKSRPYIEIYDDITGELKFTSKESSKSKQNKSQDNWEEWNTYILAKPEDLWITGSV